MPPHLALVYVYVTIGAGGGCVYRFTAATGLNGTIQSPGYPIGYRGPVACRYEFDISPPEGAVNVRDWRIRFRFIDFQLGYPHDDAENPFE
jgi:hypothetical protein